MYWNGTSWQAEEPISSASTRRRHRLLGATAEAGLITLLMFGLIAGTALAAKGGGGAAGGGHGGGGKPARYAGSMTMEMVSPPDVNHGEGVKFTVATNAPWPFVDVDCTQSGRAVYHSTIGYYGGWPWGDTFIMESTDWTSGGAACVATLYNSYNGRVTNLATYPFSVMP